MRAIAAIFLMTLLALPIADAHLSGSRPVLQQRQFERLPDIRPGEVELDVDLILSNAVLSDPLRHLVSHEIDPATGSFRVEYREDASIGDERFFASWRLDRLVEYRDLNVDGLFQPTLDSVVRAWRFAHYDWQLGQIQDVAIADVTGKSAVWTGNLTGSPLIRMEVAIAGKDFVDEGAVVRSQDVAIYLDVTQIPERDLGSLYALEATVRVQPDTALSFHRVENTSTALLADAEFRRGLLVWGGEGFLDGREQQLGATLEDERVEQGNKTARFVIHMPTVDESMRFVMVSGVEYATEVRRGEVPVPVAVALLAILVGARLFGRRNEG